MFIRILTFFARSHFLPSLYNPHAYDTVLAPVAIPPTPVPWQLVSHAPPARMVMPHTVPMWHTFHRMDVTVALAERTV